MAPNRRLGDNQFTRDAFTIDYQVGTLTCPDNVRCHMPGLPDTGSLHSCKGSKTYKIGEHDQLLAQARTQRRAGADLADYKQYRPMVERSVAWLVANGHRRVKYRGVERDRIAFSVRVAAINLGLDHGPIGWELAT